MTTNGYVFSGKYKSKQIYNPDPMKSFKCVATAVSLFSLVILLLFYTLGVRV